MGLSSPTFCSDSSSSAISSSSSVSVSTIFSDLSRRWESIRVENRIYVDFGVVWVSATGDGWLQLKFVYVPIVTPKPLVTGGTTFTYRLISSIGMLILSELSVLPSTPLPVGRSSNFNSSTKCDRESFSISHLINF